MQKKCMFYKKSFLYVFCSRVIALNLIPYFHASSPLLHIIPTSVNPFLAVQFRNDPWLGAGDYWELSARVCRHSIIFSYGGTTNHFS